MDLRDVKHWKRYKKSFKASLRRLRPFCEKQNVAARYIAGRHFSDSAADRRQYINLMELAMNIFMGKLVSSAPAVLVTTPYQQLDPTAANFQQAIEEQIIDLDLEKVFRRWVQNAMYSIGVLKLGIKDGGRTIPGMDGEELPVLDVFAKAVNLDNFCIDMSATLWEDAEYIGDRYRVPLEWAKECEIFDKAAREKMQPTYKGDSDEIDSEEDRMEDMSANNDQTADWDEFVDHVELWDVWVKPLNAIVTFVHGQDDLILRIDPWDGPENGPYHPLSFHEMPENIMPLPPVALWRDLHEIANTIFSRMANDITERQDVLAARAEDAEDAQKIIDTEPGEKKVTITTGDPRNIAQFPLGGLKQEDMQFTIFVKQLASYMWGNLDLLGGQGPQSKTFGQDQLLLQSANDRISQMHKQIYTQTKKVMRDLAWYEWTDQLKRRVLTKRLEGYSHTAQVAWSAETRRGRFIDFNFEIAPYSMQQQSPAAKAQTMMMIWERVIIPYAQGLEQAGGRPDVQYFLETLGKYLHINEIKGLVKFTGQRSEQVPGGGSSTPTKSPVTHRTYERVNRPGATTHGQDDFMVRLLGGSKLQDSEAASLMSPVS